MTSTGLGLWIPSLPDFQPTIHNEGLNVDKSTTGRTIGNLNPVIFKDFGILNSTLFFQLHDITMRKIIQYNSTFTQTQIKKFIQITPLGSETRLTREHNNQKENTNKCYYLCSKVNYVISKSDSVSDPKDNIKHS